MTTSTYAIAGMVCGHCAGLITAEIERIAGVTAVTADAANGTIAVSTDRDVDVAVISAAVEEAGYEVDYR